MLSPSSPRTAVRAVALPTDQLVWHEELEPVRLAGVETAVAAGQRLPPIEVVEVPGGYLIIDGAHRARAAAQLGITVRARIHHLPAETIVPGWRHLLPASTGRDLARFAEVHPAAGQGGDGGADGQGAVVTVRFDRRRIDIAGGSDPAEVHRILHDIGRVAYRRGHHRLGQGHRVQPGSAVLAWPRLPLATIVELAQQVGPLPAGVTRFASILRTLESDARAGRTPRSTTVDRTTGSKMFPAPRPRQS